MDYTRFNNLKTGTINMQGLPLFQAVLTGVDHITQNKAGAITLHYTDNTKQTKISKKDIFYDFINTVDIIEFVQL